MLMQVTGIYAANHGFIVARMCIPYSSQKGGMKLLIQTLMGQLLKFGNRLSIQSHTLLGM